MPTISGLKDSDAVTGLTETYDNANVGTGKTLSVATYTVNDGNSGGNYTVTTVADYTGVINPKPLKSLGINDLYIYWAPRVSTKYQAPPKQTPGASFSQGQVTTQRQGNDTFSIYGRLQLPQGYTAADLQKQATVTITIAGKSGSQTVVFKGRVVSWPQSMMWVYMGHNQPLGEGMNITSMTMWWAPQGTKWAGWGGLYIGGVLQLPEPIGINTTPANVKVTLEIPVTTAAGCGSLMSEQTVKCSVPKSANLWFYNVSPKLPSFPCEPTGQE
jgi:hypothetical protein